MKLIAIVGADGTGKTTQAKILESKLLTLGFRAKYIQSTYVLLELIRKRIELPQQISPRHMAIKTHNKKKSHFLIEIMLKISGIFYAFFTYIYVKITHGKYDFVISDRYFYQYFYDIYGNNATKILKIFPMPDLILWLEMNSIELRRRHREWKSIESEGDYLERISDFYKEISQLFGFKRIHVDENPLLTANTIITTIKETLFHDEKVG